jgi:hypothetical protein
VRFTSADNSRVGSIVRFVAIALVGGSLTASALPALAAQAAGGTAAPATSLAGTPDRCDKLKDLMNGRWPDSTTRIVSSSWQPASLQVKTMMGSLGPLPDHCELTAVMHERVGSGGQHYAIRFHLRLPGQWNGRFLFEGGGGTEGELGLAVGFIGMGVPPAIAQGYAVVAQDAGHDNATNSVAERGGAAAFGFDPQARADYGGASLNPVAQAAKAVIGIYYDHAPSRSYFVGCSKGGQEGMVFAQRYPDVFDGIIAGAPGFSLPRAAIAEAWDTQAFNSLVEPAGAKSADTRPLSASFSDAQFSVFREAILAACDADDGVRDGITAKFGACSWPRVEKELKHKLCFATVDASCLSETQIQVLARVYSGPRDSAGKSLYSDWPIDAGAGSPGWRIWKIGAANGSVPAINVAMGAPALAAIFTTPPTAVRADPQAALSYALAFNFDRDAAKIYATEGSFRSSAWTDIAARSPHLEAFRSHGGKMIVPQGASDPVFSLNDTLSWYREVDQLERGKASNFVRVFPVPGMAHCAGGPATDQFSAFDALIDWVEKGTAPERILAKAGPSSPWPGRTRPLCPYPKYARYSGSGSIEDAQNFSCK